MRHVAASNNNGVAVIAAFIQAGDAAVRGLRERIENVRYCPSEVAIARGVECIDFVFDGEPHRAPLQGRMSDAVIGFSVEADRKVALSLMLDGLAEKVAEAHQGDAT